MARFKEEPKDGELTPNRFMEDFEDCQIDFDSQGEEDDEKLIR